MIPNRHQLRRMFARMRARGGPAETLRPSPGSASIASDRAPPSSPTGEEARDILIVALPEPALRELKRMAHNYRKAPAEIAASMLVEVLEPEDESPREMIEVAPGQFVNDKSAKALGLIR